METSQVRQKDQWTIQNPTDTCKWYLTIELTPGVSEKLNIRMVIPYKEPTVTKSQMCKLQAKIFFIESQPHEYRCANTGQDGLHLR
jgi:hypothetical protein